MGIEPTLVAWEATVLPLNYTREALILFALRTPRQTSVCALASCFPFAAAMNLVLVFTAAAIRRTLGPTASAELSGYSGVADRLHQFTSIKIYRESK